MLFNIQGNFNISIELINSECLQLVLMGYVIAVIICKRKKLLWRHGAILFVLFWTDLEWSDANIKSKICFHHDNMIIVESDSVHVS